MSKLLLLHTVQDADDCVRRKLHDHYRLYSTHSSVDVHLKEKYGIKCSCLSSLIDNGDILAIREVATEKVDAILAALDEHIAPQLYRETGCVVRYFVPLYGYYAKYHYTGYDFLRATLGRLMEAEKVEEIAVYPYRFTALFSTDTTIDVVLRLLFPDVKVRLLESAAADRKTALRMLARKLLNPQKVLSVFRRAVNIRTSFDAAPIAGRPTVVVSEPLGEAAFLTDTLTSKYNVVYYAAGSSVPRGFQAKAPSGAFTLDMAQARTALQPVLGNDVIAALFADDVLLHFVANLQEYRTVLETIREVHTKYPVALGLWGGPPVDPVRALLYEYLRSEHVPVIGCQHGSVYGDSWEPWHFDSDFSHCDHFISFGFSQDDLRRLYPGREPDCSIEPLGKVRLPRAETGKKQIGILFPLTNSISILEGGMIRVTPEQLTARQIQLLEYLNSLENCSVYVKLFPYSTAANCSVLPVLRRLKNLHVVDDVGFSGFLETHQPRAVVIEFPSTPLLEVLHLDTEVFVMNDSLHPFETQALEELRKRVYYTEDTGEMIGLLRQFVGGTLERKRDDTFLRHYVVREHSKENIRRLVESAIAGEKPTRRKQINIHFSPEKNT